jgi:hypothetical protein
LLRNDGAALPDIPPFGGSPSEWGGAELLAGWTGGRESFPGGRLAFQKTISVHQPRAKHKAEGSSVMTRTAG